ncbi:uncharacterized protein PFLUO_LOCUS1835 [Penicillium psychrofluorescens]|uniref:uncharacterized protein n=1 Tax=Penicillium psychrofluorescens TaxID=3158075 RepID=UPI003CCCDDAE
MPRKVRAAAQAASNSMKSTPVAADASDEEMLDAPPSQTSSPAADEKDPDVEADLEADAEPSKDVETPVDTPAESKQGADDEEGNASAATPAADDTTLLGSGDTPSYNGGRQSVIPRKRGPGRPPKNRPPDWDALDGTGSPLRVTTPVKRRRGRPAASGGRWARNRGPSHMTQVPIDKEGNMMDVIDDEVSLPPEPEGDSKVDKNGVLQGGREYRVRTFTILNRDDRLYMLSTEPARCIGFRDSYLFFQKHKMLYKIIIDDDAKRDLIEREIIPHSYKGRAIGVVTARSVFREFGAKIVVGGKKVDDDYHAQAARERGDVEGELAVPEDRLPRPGEEYNRNQYVAWHGASSVYHTNAPSIPVPGGKPVDSRKRRVTVTGDNWMLEHAREASGFNARLATMRRANLGGIYDVHTNIIQTPKIMQPSHVRWERLPPPDPRAPGQLMKDMSSLSLTNGTATPQESTEATHQHQESTPTTEEGPEQTQTIFPSIPASLARRFVIHDIHYESPPVSNMGIPGPDGDVHDLGANGMITAADPQHPEFMSADVLDELPADCKEALLASATQEWEWKSKWCSEAADGARSRPLKNFAWFP